MALVFIVYTLICAGGRVVHSYGRLIPHEYPITNLQQISGPDGIGRITCTVSSGTARFIANGGQLETGGVTQTGNRATSTLVVNPSNVESFQNRDLYCTNAAANFFYLFISSASKYTSHYLQSKQWTQPIFSHKGVLYVMLEVLHYNVCFAVSDNFF